MGNHESKPNEAAPRERPSHTHRDREERRERPAPISTSGSAPQTKPVFIPASNTANADKTDRAGTSTPNRATSTIPVEDEDQVSALPPVDFDFIRPPRLPLAIGEEEYAPGSPIFSPQHLADNVDSQPLDPGTPTKSIDITRRTSLLSSTTADEEDEQDEYEGRNDELQHEGLAGTVKSVPTLVEWFEGGDKVYVTGTFANWDRKIKLRRDGPSRRPGALSANIQFLPGTHHIRFIADGDMRTSKHLPTAVDFAGFLVNYIEVVPGPPSAAGSTTSTVDKALTAGPPVATAPLDIPATRQAQHQLPHRLQEHRPSLGLTPQTSQPSTPDTAAQPKVPQDKPYTERTTPVPTAATAPTAKEKSTQKRPAHLVKGPTKRYHSEIPKFLLDFDAPDESSRLTRANAVATTLPPPPSLPMFLAKSILNKDTPMKDDASVLVLPNHTVLNHLATSSIKNKVLATSATTRYNDKMLTTIMYKPTGERQEVA